jgi:hypothetical protein
MFLELKPEQIKILWELLNKEMGKVGETPELMELFHILNNARQGVVPRCEHLQNKQT